MMSTNNQSTYRNFFNESKTPVAEDKEEVAEHMKKHKSSSTAGIFAAAQESSNIAANENIDYSNSNNNNNNNKDSSSLAITDEEELRQERLNRRRPYGPKVFDNSEHSSDAGALGIIATANKEETSREDKIQRKLQEMDNNSKHMQDPTFMVDSVDAYYDDNQQELSVGSRNSSGPMYALDSDEDNDDEQELKILKEKYKHKETTDVQTAILLSKQQQEEVSLGSSASSGPMYALDSDEDNDDDEALQNLKEKYKRKETDEINTTLLLSKQQQEEEEQNIDDTNNDAIEEGRHHVLPAKCGSQDVNTTGGVSPGAFESGGFSISSEADRSIPSLSASYGQTTQPEYRFVDDQNAGEILAVPEAFAVEDDDDNYVSNQIVYEAKEIEPCMNQKRMLLLIFLIIFIIIVIAVSVSVPLVTKRNDSNGSIGPEPTVTLVLQLDSKPNETSWTMHCIHNGSTVFDDDSPPGTYVNQPYKKIETPLHPPDASKCTFTLFASENDGIDGSDSGYYELFYGADILNSASRIVHGEFGMSSSSSIVSSNFTVELPYIPWVQVGNDIDGLYPRGKSGYVSISEFGHMIVVGAPATASVGLSGSAQAYKFDTSTNTWTKLGQSLRSTNSSSSKEGNNTEEEDQYGKTTSLSTHDNRNVILAIGAPSINDHIGAVYIYSFNSTSNEWDLNQIIHGNEIGDEFGSSVSLSSDGSTIIIGADQYVNDWINNNHTHFGPGYVKAYRRQSNETRKGKDQWSQVGETLRGIIKTSSKDKFGDEYGNSVAISYNGNIIAIGAPDRDNGQGYAQIFQYDATSDKWENFGNNNAEIFSRWGRFGDGISLSSDGTIVAISEPWSAESAGTVKVYRINGKSNNWEQMGQEIVGEDKGDVSGEFEGVSMSSDGMTLAVGSHLHDNPNRKDSGSVRIYEYDSTANEWVVISQDIDGEGSNDKSGYSISMNGNGSMVIIGAYGNNNNHGHARVYQRGVMNS